MLCHMVAPAVAFASYIYYVWLISKLKKARGDISVL